MKARELSGNYIPKDPRDSNVRRIEPPIPDRKEAEKLGLRLIYNRWNCQGCGKRAALYGKPIGTMSRALCLDCWKAVGLK